MASRWAWFCPGCGTRNQPGGSDCASCGARVTASGSGGSASSPCEHCGARSPESAAFCIGCGRTIDPSRPTSPALVCSAVRELSVLLEAAPVVVVRPEQPPPVRPVRYEAPPGPNHVTVQVAVVNQTPPLIVTAGTGPNLVLRFLWFVCVGWWLGGLVSAFAWLCFVLILPFPLGLWIVNRLPSVITLRAQEQTWHVHDGLLRQGQRQIGLSVRALYFVLIGWWFSGLWMAAAWLLMLPIVTLPISFWMYGRVGAVTTLFRS